MVDQHHANGRKLSTSPPGRHTLSAADHGYGSWLLTAGLLAVSELIFAPLWLT